MNGKFNEYTIEMPLSRGVSSEIVQEIFIFDVEGRCKKYIQNII